MGQDSRRLIDYDHCPGADNVPDPQQGRDIVASAWNFVLLEGEGLLKYGLKSLSGSIPISAAIRDPKLAVIKFGAAEIASYLREPPTRIDLVGRYLPGGARKVFGILSEPEPERFKALLLTVGKELLKGWLDGGSPGGTAVYVVPVWFVDPVFRSS